MTQPTKLDLAVNVTGAQEAERLKTLLAGISAGAKKAQDVQREANRDQERANALLKEEIALLRQGATATEAMRAARAKAAGVRPSLVGEGINLSAQRSAILAQRQAESAGLGNILGGVSSAAAAAQDQQRAQMKNLLRGITVAATKASQDEAAALSVLLRRLNPVAAKEQEARKQKELLTRAIAAGNPLVAQYGITAANAGKRVRELMLAQTAATGTTSRLTQSLAGYFSVFGALFLVRRFTTALIDNQKQMDKINAILFAVEGSSDAVSKKFADIAKIAKELSVPLGDVASGYGRLQLAAKGTVLEGQKVDDLFIAITKTSAALRFGTTETNRVFRAFEQILSKGKVSAEEVRQQLGDQIPGAFRIFAEAAKRAGLSETVADFDKLIAQGKIFSNDILPEVTNVLTDAFGGAAQKNAESLVGQLNNLNTATTLLLKSFNENKGAAGALTEIIRQLTAQINELNAGMEGSTVDGKALGQAIIAASKAFVYMAGAAVLGLVIARLFAAGAALRSTIAFVGAGSTIASIRTFGIAWKAALGPIGLLLIGGSALFEYFARVRENSRNATREIVSFGDSLDNVDDKTLSVSSNIALDRIEQLGEAYSVLSEQASKAKSEGNIALESALVAEMEKVSSRLTEQSQLYKEINDRIQLRKQIREEAGREATDAEVQISNLNKQAAELKKLNVLLAAGIPLADAKLQLENEAAAATEAGRAALARFNAERALNARLTAEAKSEAKQLLGIDKEAEKLLKERIKLEEILRGGQADLDELRQVLELASQGVDVEQARNRAMRDRLKIQAASLDPVEAARAQQALDRLRIEDRLSGIKEENELRKDAAKQEREINAKTADQFSEAMTDALFRAFENGKSFGDAFVETLQNSLNTLVIKPGIDAIISPLKDSLGGFIKGLFGPAGGTGGGPPLNTLPSGASAALASIGPILGAVGAAISVFELAKGISREDSQIGNKNAYALSLTNPLTAAFAGLDKAFGGNVFGTKFRTIANDITISLQDGILDATITTLQRRKKSFGRGSKYREFVDTAEALDDELNAMFVGILGAFVENASLAGLDTSNLDVTVRRSALGDPNAVQNALEDVLASLAVRLIPNLADYRIENENLSDTYARVTRQTISFNRIIGGFGGAIEELTGAGGVAAVQALAELSGGFDSLAQNSAKFFGAFFSQEEQIARATELLAADLSGLGFALPSTRDEFRSLVTGLDLTTESGQEAFAALIGLADAADTVFSSFEEAIKKSMDLAKSLNDFIKQLNAEFRESPIESSQRTLSEFREQSQLALGGDSAAAAGLQALASQVIEFARQSYASGAGFQVIFDEVVAALSAVANNASQSQGPFAGMQTFARGGIADSPSIFAEAGPEAAIPLPDGRNVPVIINREADAEIIRELREQNRNQSATVRVLIESSRQMIEQGKKMIDRLAAIEDYSRMEALSGR